MEAVKFWCLLSDSHTERVMEKWLLKHCLVSVCLVLTCMSAAFGNEVYFRKQSNASIEISCVAPEEHEDPFAFTLSREAFQQGKVLYHNFRMEPSVMDSSFNDRIMAKSNKNQVLRVTVSIMRLQTYDTDVYTCLFHYDTPTGFKNLSGRSKVFLYVTDCYAEPCSCYSYTPLLFSLSAAAGLLFLIVLILTAVRCIKPSRGGRAKPQLSVPIYEEMNGVREKQSSRGQDHEVPSLFGCPKKENPYIN